MTEKIQKLRELTGAGVMDCRNALLEAQSDFDKALQIIKQKGFTKAAKRADRTTGAGVLEAYVHNDRVGVLLELRSETDFVARSPVFKDLAHKLVMQIAAMDPSNIEELLKQPYIKDESETIAEVVKHMIGNVGENIEIARFARYEL
ncbi:MAG: translation elongation factor Ts [Candidatus Harrisonbacteria bacterium RIFCSPLOWO2_01_FULL_40_28]|uniref:Elongation factor Ts n=1 Tax=Candidatus Harrisonbacteria bacterium RIFCSPLOWO2_01_FULL_40_28 TaxID=1798406 RepID=A0A1G1ZKE4_9BACT|nr:MAG: translation elongation factor Ts [Candidatus Harrisonbacteria bacterium RIFCSPLOWO2_01_FULL_40_28]